jgi:hypothetical protein
VVRTDAKATGATTNVVRWPSVARGVVVEFGIGGHRKPDSSRKDAWKVDGQMLIAGLASSVGTSKAAAFQRGGTANAGSRRTGGPWTGLEF